MAQTFDELFYSKFNNLAITLENRPLVLGSVTASNGGSLGRPGGFDGKLAQTLVSYDLSEDAILIVPASGESLLDNLNRIRYRIQTLEENPTGLESVNYNGTPVVESGVVVLNFIGDITVVGTDVEEVTIGLSHKSLYGEDLTDQIPASGDIYTVENDYYAGTLRLFYNGLRMRTIHFSETSSGTFTTTFTTISGDAIFIDYEYNPSTGYGNQPWGGNYGQ